MQRGTPLQPTQTWNTRNVFQFPQSYVHQFKGKNKITRQKLKHIDKRQLQRQKFFAVNVMKCRITKIREINKKFRDDFAAKILILFCQTAEIFLTTILAISSRTNQTKSRTNLTPTLAKPDKELELTS